MTASLAKALLGPNRAKLTHPTTYDELDLDRIRGNIHAAYLRRLLKASKGNVSAAARRANRPRRTFRTMLERYGVDANDYRS